MPKRKATARNAGGGQRDKRRESTPAAWPREHQMRRVLESAASAMVMVNSTGEIVLVNGQMETFFGYARDELIGQPIELLVPVRYRAKHPEHRAGFVANPQNRPMGAGRDLYGVRKDGSEFPVEIGLSPIDTEEGTMVLATVADITQRKEHERALARLAAIVESSDDAILSKTLEGTITSWNAAAERMYGYTAAEMVGQSVALLLPADRPGEVDGLLARLAKGERIKDFETVRQTKKGRRIDVSLTISPVYDRRGRVVGASTIARDITERKRGEMQLRLLQLVTEAISTSSDFESAMAGAMCTICKTIGWDYGEAWVPDDDPCGLRQCGPYVATRDLEPFARASKELSSRGLPGRVWSSGEPEWVLDVSSESRGTYPRSDVAADVGLKAGFGVPIMANEQISAVLVFFMEAEPREEDLRLVIDLVQSVASQLGAVVRRKQIDAQLQIANAELEQKNREMEEFVYTVSHDLKSPLVSIGGMLGLLKEELLEGRLVDAGEIIAAAEETVISMRDSIEDFLELSRIGQTIGELRSVDLNEVVRDVVNKHTPEINDQGLAVVVEEGLPMVQGSRERLAEVFDNLVVNALKYACDGAEPGLVIGTRAGSGEVRVFVQDNGPGIEEAFHEKVFGLFERLHGTAKGGAGVGLAIVRRLMQMHGGRVWVESAAGRGATFWLAFPASAALHAAH